MDRYGRGTLFLPDLVGQVKFWVAIGAKEAQKASRIIQLGNFLSVYTETSDLGKVAYNTRLNRVLSFYRKTADEWLQVAGPNEILVLNSPEKWTRDQVDADVRRMWFQYDTPVNMHTSHVDKGRLVTHGGLTYGEWMSLGSPETAEDASRLLNEKYDKTLFQGECLALGNAPNFSANPIFANPVLETYPSWITAPVSCPFGQVHAGENMNTGYGRELRGTLSPYLGYASYSLRKFGSIANIRGQLFWGLFLGLPAYPVSRIPGKSLLLEVEQVEN